MKKKTYGFTIVTDAAFKTTMVYPQSKTKGSKSQGIGNKPRTSDSLTDEEIEKLCASKCLGIESPQAVINTLWLIHTFRPSRRQRTERVRLGRCQTHANVRRKRVFRKNTWLKDRLKLELALTLEIREILSLECTQLPIY